MTNKINIEVDLIARRLGKTIRMISAEAGEQEELTCLTEMR